jgi:hypothetical protein
MATTLHFTLIEQPCMRNTVSTMIHFILDAISTAV